MRYLSFKIKNFKGIKETEIDLRSATGANVFSLVGLNESGKTTILEAIHSFSPDYRTRSLRNAGVKSEAEAARERLPRHLLARFTGEIAVEATVSITAIYRSAIVDRIKKETGISVIGDDIPDTFILRRADVFERGDYKSTRKTFSFDLRGRKKGERKDRVLTGGDYDKAYAHIWIYCPDIAYHDSFIFDFPKRIYLTNRPGSSDWVYRTMFEDVLAAGRVPYTLSDVTRRVRNERYKMSWVDFFSAWSQENEKDKVQQILDQASETITDAVFGKWNKIFGEEVGGKEIYVQHGLEKGRRYLADKRVYEETDEHDLYISLEIRQGTRRFPVQDRSLGFRWFFAFLLFTQFRTKKETNSPVLFLFDEPAANLHSAAQERLIESFPEIASGNNMLMYSTHSHYMISPDWLEQTFIVTNAADSPDISIVDSAIIEDESLDIEAQRYRSFVNQHPSDTSYFQPIIDRLEVHPSKFDITLPSIILEGKSDFYVLRYAVELYKIKEIRLIPATGSGTFDALIALGATWGTKFLFLLDSDSAGLKERERYALDHGARPEAVICLGDFGADLKQIESLLDDGARKIIKEQLGSATLSKKLMMRFFQEQLAKRKFIPLGKTFEEQSKMVLGGLAKKLQNL